MGGRAPWFSESSAPHGSKRFQGGWFAGVRDVASYLLRITDTTATAQRGRAASSTPASRPSPAAGLPRS
ncbi:hypothetical protein [Streptomyces sp. NPDC048560]|uniref:hypothetical protein n=1 Tax=Streptomyces sp. NPDC048560 TaxID=3155488 RepID=UPI003423312E